MATYYLTSAGSNTSPYDTEEKGATSMWSIRALPGLVAADTIVLCTDVTDTTFDGANYEKMCNITAKAGLGERPSYHFNTGGSGPWMGSVAINMTGIKFIHNNPGAASFYGTASVKCNDCIVENRTSNQVYMKSQTGHEFKNSLFISSYANTVTNPPFVQGEGIGKMIIENSTFIRNGAMSCPMIYGDVEVYNSIFYAPDKTGIGTGSAMIRLGSDIVTDFSIIASNIWDSNESVPLIVYEAEFGTLGTVYPTGTNNTFTDPLFAELVGYTLSQSSPAIGSGIGGINIGWDQATQKASAVAVRFTTGSSSYFGNEFYPPFTGGVGSVPHAF